MEYEYDPEVDILTIKLSNKKPDFGEQTGPVITHYSKEGKPIELEILDASTQFFQLSNRFSPNQSEKLLLDLLSSVLLT